LPRLMKAFPERSCRTRSDHIRLTSSSTRSPVFSRSESGGNRPMETYEIELEPAEPGGFAATILALPGVLVFGDSIDQVLARARAAIAFHVGVSSGRQIAVSSRVADRVTQPAA
jgi:predicted RNase H-like HicB family nuclease